MACAGGASADVAAGLFLMVSTDGGTWLTTGEVYAGQTATVGLFGWYRCADCFGVVVCQIQGNRIDPAEILSAGSRYGDFTFGAARHGVFSEGGGFRIDDADDASNEVNRGIPILQNSPAASGGGFTANPAFPYTFTIEINSTRGYAIDLAAPLEQIKNGVIGVYSSSFSLRTTHTRNISTQGARLYVNVPGPGGVGLLAAAGVVALRRRRA